MNTNNETSNPRQENCPWMMPILYVNDVQKSLDFYQKAFNFIPDMTMKDDNGVIDYADMVYKGEKLFMILREGSEYAPEGASPKTSNSSAPLSLYVYCDDVDALAKQAGQNNATTICNPEDAPWGDRTAVFKDPDEFVWSFATKIQNFEHQQKTA